MKDEHKTKAQLIEELDELRQHRAESKGEQEEKDRLLTAFYQIGQAILSTMDLEEILDALARQIIEASIFRSLMIALVEEETHSVRMAYSLTLGSMREGKPIQSEVDRAVIGITYDLDDKDILADVVRRGQIEVIEGWDERYSLRTKPEHREGQVAYFVPVKKSGRVVAVLATGSTVEEKEETLRRIEIMQPLLDLVAIALEHARLYTELVRKERLVSAFERIAVAASSSLRMDDILDRLAQEIFEAGVFRSLMIALVDEATRTVEVVRGVVSKPFSAVAVAGAMTQQVDNGVGIRYGLDDKNITAEVARMGEMRVIVEWDDRLDSRFNNPMERQGQVAYFLPVKSHEGRVVAVLATASRVQEKEVTLHRIQIMQPLLDQMAIALEHARLYRDLQREMTERKKTEETLRASEEQFRTLAETAQVAIFIYQKEKNVYSNPIARAITGYTQEQLASMDFWEIIHPDHRDLVRTRGMARQQGDPVVPRYEVKLLTKSGVTRWMDASMAPFEFEKQPAVLGVAIDVTDRKRAEVELRDSQARFLSFMDNSPAIAWMKDEQGRHVYLSRTYEERFGVKLDAWLGKTDFEVWPREIAEKFRAADLEVVDNGKTIQVVEETKNPDGTHCYWNNFKFLLEDASGRRFVGGIGVDITDRKHMEQELIRLERMKARSEMVQGVNHNLNNLLNGVLLPAQLLKIDLEDPENRQRAELIETAAQRAAELVRRLNRAAQGREEKLQSVDVSSLVLEVVEDTKPRWKTEAESKGNTIEVVSELEEVPPIRGTPSELHDILVNLIFNAVDALPEGGTITISTQAMEDYVHLTVRDTGIGMDEDVCKRAFEPLFTTKLDSGSGLGLYTVYTTVGNWGGDINVDSTLGEGTTFTLRLPIWTEMREAQGDDIEEVHTSSEQRVKMLLVEDDEITNQTLVDYLSDTCQVKVAMDGQTAVEDFTSGRYEVALIDLGIPGIPGDRVAQLLRQADPSIAIVLITGFDLAEDDVRLASFDLRPIMSGVLMMSIGMGMSAMSAVGGQIAEVSGYRPVFGIGAAVTGIAFLLFIWHFRRPRIEFSTAA